MHKSDEGYAVGAVGAVGAAGLPGCWSQGATEAEALENIADAIREYLDATEPPEEGWQEREVEVN